MTESLMAQLPALEMTLAAGVHLFTERWLDYSRNAWSVSPKKVRFFAEGSDSAWVEAAYYLDRNGRIWKPPFSPGPYLPLAFRANPAASRRVIDEQWLDVGQQLANDMRERGLVGGIALPPDVTDVRPWMWAGFRIEVLYTYCVDLPYDETLMRPQIRRSMTRAAKAGYTCARVTNLNEVYSCLAETQERQGFDLGISAEDLTQAQRAMGADMFRAYVAYSPEGEAVSATVELHEPGGTAVGWLAGTKHEHLRTGVSQLLHGYIMDDLAAAGATSYDFAGANLPSVAQSKVQWGATLKPFYRVEAGTVTEFARHARKFWRFHRARS